MDDDQQGFGRRGFLSGIGVAASAAAVAAPGKVLAHGLVPATDASPLGLSLGDRLAGAEVVAVHPLRYGAAPVVLEDADGRRLQLDVLAYDDDPAHPDGVGNTETFSVFVVNSGDGSTATDEGPGLCAMALATLLAGREAPGGLLTFAERRARHPDAAYAVPDV